MKNKTGTCSGFMGAWSKEIKRMSKASKVKTKWRKNSIQSSVFRAQFTKGFRHCSTYLLDAWSTSGIHSLELNTQVHHTIHGESQAHNNGIHRSQHAEQGKLDNRKCQGEEYGLSPTPKGSQAPKSFYGSSPQFLLIAYCIYYTHYTPSTKLKYLPSYEQIKQALFSQYIQFVCLL